MAKLNDKLRIKKLYELKADIDKVVRDVDGLVKVPTKEFDEISAEQDMYDLIDDHAKYSTFKPVLKQLEDLRQDVEDIHGYIISAFGDDPASVPIGGGGSSGIEYHETLIATTKTAKYSSSMYYLNPFSPSQFGHTSYSYAAMLLKSIADYEIVLQWAGGLKTVTGFKYCGWDQYANASIKTCKIYAVTDVNNFDRYFSNSPKTGNLTLIWNSIDGNDPEFPMPVLGDYRFLYTNETMDYKLAEPIDCHGLLIQVGTNWGHASFTDFYRWLFYNEN